MRSAAQTGQGAAVSAAPSPWYGSGGARIFLESFCHLFEEGALYKSEKRADNLLSREDEEAPVDGPSVASDDGSRGTR